jgi:hypothetical protein
MGGVRRRSFLKRSAVAAGALAAGWPGYASAQLPGRLRKCLAMDSLNHGGDVEDLRLNGNLYKLQALGVRSVRVWIRWDKAQPFPPAFVTLEQLGGPANDIAGCGTGCGYRYIQAIDAQIALARAVGLRVILTTWFHPRWANGTADKPLDWAREDRGSATTPLERLKPLEWRVPVGQLGPDGYYGQWLGWLMDRYAIHGRGLVLEIMNEPNGQLWPQQGPSRTADPYGPGEPIMAAHVGEMIATAQALSARRGHRLGLAAPALSDRIRPDDRLFTGIGSMVPATLGVLAEHGFPPAPTFVWSHHNYWDIEHDLGVSSRTGELAELLRGGWWGRGGPADPRIWLTEGGARIGSGEVRDQSDQALLVAAAWARTSALPAVELFSNYLMYTSPAADCGLCDSLEAGGAPRPVWEVFRQLPA